MKSFSGEMLGEPINSITYGQEPKAFEKWHQIITIKNIKKRHKAIDSLLNTMITNKETNGFFSAQDEIVIRVFPPCSIKLDDKNLYYDFFDTLKENFETNQLKEKPMSELGLISYTIKMVTQNYFGAVPTDLNLRHRLTAIRPDENDNMVVPSISNLKGRDSAACVELASSAHNLWLLSGNKSYFVHAKDCALDESQDGHAFVFVEKPDNFVLYDLARNKLKNIDFNPIEKILNDKPLVINNEVYTNARFVNAKDVTQNQKIDENMANLPQETTEVKEVTF
ncbi:MAG: hypothetical protein AB7S44_03370 [Spirochaetales bacterium]